ncbi:MAG: polyisoprenoid-binding protein [Halioglobus sp.]|nr:polyisoprenoid-binding protein [Halioglobus sp.]
MVKTFRTALVVLLCSLPLAALADLTAIPSGKYTLDKTHGYITFSYSHLGFSTPQVGFNSFDVVLNLDTQNPQKSTLEVLIDAASIDSRVEEFDEHLTGEEFFNTAKYPDIRFESTDIKKTGESTFDIVGNMTIMGQTHPVTFAATINKAGKNPMKKVDALGVSAETKILRSQWGLGRYAPAVGDEVTIQVTAEMFYQE